MPDLTIGEIARRAGVRPSAIRYYEEVGLLPRARRVAGQRRYDASILDRLAIVRLAQHVGLQIREIKWLLNDVPGRPPPERWRQLAHTSLSPLCALVAPVSTKPHANLTSSIAHGGAHHQSARHPPYLPLVSSQSPRTVP